MITTDQLFKLIEPYLFAFPSKEDVIREIFNDDIISFTTKTEEDIEKEINENLNNYFKKQFEDNKLVELTEKYIEANDRALSRKNIIFLDEILANSEYEPSYEDLESLLEIPELKVYVKKTKNDKTNLVERIKEFQELQEFEKELNKVSYEYDGDNIVDIYMADKDRYDLLTPAEERYYIKKYQEEGDHEAYDILAGANQGLCIKVAKMYLNRGLSLLDLIQEGNMGLIKAINRFDLSKKTKLSTYATWWILQAVKLAVRDSAKTIHIPRGLIDIQYKIKRVEETYSSKTKSEPSIEELAEIIGVSEKRIREAKKYDLTMVSFDKPIMNNDEDNDSTLGDFLTSDAIEAPEKGSEDQAEHEVYEFLLNKLIEKKGVTKPERTVQVIRLRYGSELYNEETYKLIKKYNLPFKEKYTLKDVGKIFGVTRERIRQLQAKGIDKMIDYTELYNVDIYERENYKQKLKRRLLKEEEYQEKIKRGQEKKEEE